MQIVIPKFRGRRFVVAVLLCATLLSAALLSETPSAQAADTSDIAPPPRLLFTLDAAKCWSGAEAEKVRTVSSVHPIIPTWWVNDVEKSIGVSGDDISRVMAFVTADGHGGVGLLTNKPYDLKQVLGAIAPGATEANAAGRKYYVSPAGMAVLSLSDKELLFSSAEGMPQVLKSKVGKSAAAEFVQNTLAAKPSKVGLAFRLHPPQEGIPDGATVFEGLSLVLKASECTLLIEGDDNSLKVILRATYPNEQAAAQGAENMQKFVELLRKYMGEAQTEMSKFFAAQDAKFPGSKALGERLNGALVQAEAALTAAKVETRGKVVETQATIATKEPVTTAVLLSTLIPRPAKKPGERNPGE